MHRCSARSLCAEIAVALALTVSMPMFAGPAFSQGAPAGIAEVPRERTLVAAVDGGRGKFYDIWSTYNLGGNHQNGNSLLYEPLYFFDGLTNKTYPWLAESFSYNGDYTELTYKLRDGVAWSDGTRFTSDDVAYTYNTLRDFAGSVPNSKQFGQELVAAVVVDPRTVTLKFKRPAPKFHDFLTYKGDGGVFIVPKHVFEKQKWAEFTNYDRAKGYPVTTGAWRVAFTDPTQRIIDRVKTCEEWWGCKTGFMPLPAVERFVLLTGLNDAQRAQAMIKNDIDTTRVLSVETMKKILADNPAAVSWFGKEAPYGMASWWPTSLILNNRDKHLSKRDVRWAISYFIDRDQTNDVAFSGAGQPSKMPWPAFAGFDIYDKAIADLLQKYPTDKYDPAKGEKLLTSAGYAKGADGYWANADGPITCDIVGSNVFADQGPVLAEQLRQHGIRASYGEPPNFFELMNGGKFTCAITGRTGASGGDPYLTLALYTTEVEGAEIGSVAHNPNNFFKYSNREFDAIVRELGSVGPDNPQKSKELVRKAMEIWLPDLPDIQLFEFMHRPVFSTAHWTNWPGKDNPYMSGLPFMHNGMAVTLHTIQPAKQPRP